MFNFVATFSGVTVSLEEYLCASVHIHVVCVWLCNKKNIKPKVLKKEWYTG